MFFNNGSLIYEYNQSTDYLGLLNITIPSNLLMLNETHKNHTIIARFLFPQTQNFKNNSLSLEFFIEGIKITEKTKHSIIQDIIFIGSLILPSLLVGIVLYIKKKRPKNSEIFEPDMDELNVNDSNIEEINIDSSNIEEINVNNSNMEEISIDDSNIEEINID